MKRQMSVLCALLASGAVLATPQPNDYAQGIELTVGQDRPLAETLLPDSVYQTITRVDLGDIRVFNASGTSVPHAFCASPSTVEPVITQETLPVFDLQAPTEAQAEGAQVEVQTANGTQIKVQEAGSSDEKAEVAKTETWAHVIDARAISDPLRSMQFDWHSPDGASQARVRIEASDDLDQWHTVVSDSTLLRVAKGDKALQRIQVPLPQQQYHYLRVVRVDRGPALQITEVLAERVATPAVIEPVWFTAAAVDATDSKGSPKQLLFDAGRLAPITYARLVLPQDNSSVRVRIQSRNNDKVEWRERWSGEFFSISTEGEQRNSPPAEITADHDRYWRVEYTQGEPLAVPPALELGYRPARLRFMAQGDGPFMLAFGSQRAEVAPVQQCNSLLSGVKDKELMQMVEEAAVGPQQTLGGAVAFKPLPKQTPVRLMVLWGVLIVGVGLLVAMAVSLLKRARQPHQANPD